MNQMQPMQQFNNPVVDATSHPVLQSVQIDEDILLKCIQFWRTRTLLSATIEKKLSEIDKQLNMLAQVDVAIRDVLAKYEHNCTRKNSKMNNLVDAFFCF
uniref:Uncharacterized protein n=1 Tax=Ditylenchus dipsaci TaxID=166011 RepID=A0A915CV31_9BILA